MDSATKIDISPKCLKKLLAMAFPHERVVGERELTDGYCNRAYWIDFSTRDPVVLKAGPPEGTPMLRYEKDLIRREAQALQWTAKNTDVPVPKVLWEDYSCTELAGHYLFMEALEGVPYNTVKTGLIKKRGIKSVEYALGAMVKQLNSHKGKGFGYPHGLCENWYEAICTMFGWLLDDAEDYSIPLPVERKDFITTLLHLRPILDEVKEPRFVHWDLWPGNVMIRPQNTQRKSLQYASFSPKWWKENWEVSGLFDFERVLWADPLMEYNFGHEYPRHYFCQGYGEFSRLNSHEKLRRSLYDLYHLLVINVEDGPRKYGVKDFHQHFGALLMTHWKKLQQEMAKAGLL